ncbi:ankyrin repeat-containing protein [Anaeramoeba flamelloides]|uniref:Ankyrin repeat-containing protein n=1 Tax=Anaeramoeba flamelloides TaxID=1746091 RepID=A0ABQ8YH81_9EUKA|nr:ankyrin repeat-containing protein [Anaeramoeba flamelloides]
MSQEYNKEFLDALESKNQEAIKLTFPSDDLKNYKQPILSLPSIKQNKLETIKLLMQLGCKKELNRLVDEEYFLFYCLRKGFPLKTIELFVEEGADPGLKDPQDGSTLLHICIEEKLDLEYIKYLKDFISLSEPNDFGETILGMCLESTILDYGLLLYLVENGASLKIKNSDNQTPLHIACEQDTERDLIELMIKKGADVNLEDGSGMLPIQYLFRKKVGIRTLKVFFEAGVDPNTLDPYRNNLLHWCCFENLGPNFEYLIKIGVSTKALNSTNETPLHLLMKNPNAEIGYLKKLIGSGCDPNIVNVNGVAALQMSLETHQKEEILDYLSNCTDLTILDNKKDTFINYLILNDFPFQMVKDYFQKGCPIDIINDSGFSTLHYACKQPKLNFELIKFLIENGNKNNIATKKGELPFLFAIMNNTVTKEICQLLLFESIVLDKITNDTILEVYFDSGNNDLQVVKLLVENGAQLVSKVENDIDTLLNLLMRTNPSKECLKYFLDIGDFDVNLITTRWNYSTCPLLYAVENNSIPCIQVLLDHGADINILLPPGNKPLLNYAVFMSDYEIVEFLIKKGIKIENGSGYTPLHVVCEATRPSNFQLLLLQNGANINAMDEYSQKPIHILFLHASDNDRKKMVRMYEMVKNFFDYGMDAKDCYIKGESFLHLLLYNEILYLPLFSLLLEKGLDPNFQDVNKNTPLNVYLKDDNIRFLLLLHGADPNIKNNKNKSPLDHNKGNIRKLNKKMLSYQEDFFKLYSESLFTDFEIKNCKIHKTFVEARIEKKIDQQVIKIFEKFDDIQLETFFNWVYSGFLPKNNEDLTFIQDICKQLELFEKIESKSNKKGLQLDLQRILMDEDSMDFTIKIDDDYIICHKFILIARSNLFKSMFININEKDIKEITNYHIITYESLELLIHFLYTDQINFIADHDVELVTEELTDSIDYYQLNKNNILTEILNLKKILFEEEHSQISEVDQLEN